MIIYLLIFPHKHPEGTQLFKKKSPAFKVSQLKFPSNFRVDAISNLV